MCGNYLGSEDFNRPLESDRIVLVLQEGVTHPCHPMLERFCSHLMPH